MILLDALDPGSPAQLVANCQQAGAAGALGYVWHGSASSHDTGGWTRAHFDALLAAGLIARPIASCAAPFPAPEAIVAAAQSFGFTAGRLFQDMEGPANLPPQSWWNGAIPVYRGAGFLAAKYGNYGDVSGYAVADGWWLAYYRQHTVQPAPTSLPTEIGYAGQQVPVDGLVGWQYANEVDVGGVTYDASFFDPAIFQEAAMLIAIGSAPDQNNPGNFLLYEHIAAGWQQIPGSGVYVLSNECANPSIVTAAGEVLQWNGNGWTPLNPDAFAAHVPAPGTPGPHSHTVSLSGTTSSDAGQ